MADEDIEWKDVLSSRVSKVGYDDQTQTLYVVWSKSGKTSAYSGVPADVADQFAKAWSVGSAVNDLLAGYPMEYL